MDAWMLRADALVKHYGDVAAVQGVSLEVRPGEIVGMVGNNGAGKTTLLKMLSGLMRPDSGSVRVDGADPARAATRVHLGFLPEDAPLYEHQDALSYLAFFGSLYGVPRKQAVEQGRRILTRLRLDPKHWTKRLGELSKGSARKVALARCLLHAPRLLILDEPTSGLDPASRRDLDRFLRDLADAGAAVLLSAHDLKQVETICDRILVVHDGRVRLQGPLGELRQRVGGTTYTLHATVAFPGSRSEGGAHTATFTELAALEAAMHAVTDAGGAIVEMEGIPPSLEHVLAAVEAP